MRHKVDHTGNTMAKFVYNGDSNNDDYACLSFMLHKNDILF